jgi:pimeloyl-ACP methyl ester carboxylesterase
MRRGWQDVVMDARDLMFPGDGVQLSGTLTVPDGVADCPAVLLIGGSGPADRHNDGLFDALGRHLVAAGIGLLAYDKRGVGESSGSWVTAGVDELAGDARCAVEVLRAHPRVNGDAVGVFGHSEGGWVALRLCARHPSIGKLILNSCPGVSLIDAEIFAMTAAGMSSADAEAGGGLLRDLAEAAAAEDGYERAKHLVAAAAGKGWYQPLAAGGFGWDATSWARIRAWARYDPRADLNAVATPALIVFGADDPLVPVAASARVFETTAAHAGRQQEIAVFPQAGHRLQTESTGGFAAGYLDRLTDWILQGA